MDPVKKPAADEISFDFDAYRTTATDDYIRIRPSYEAFASVLRDIIREALRQRKIKFHAVDARAKSPESFGAKAAMPADDDPGSPKYQKPLEQITDLVGVRVITYLLRTVDDVQACVEEEFEVIEKIDLGRSLIEEQRLGYQSVHYIVKLSAQRAALPEYEPFKALVAEVQVRTVLQHAWAEIEHDIQYKSTATIPLTIRRRFMALAGVLEIADREFQMVQDEDTTLRDEARASVHEGDLRRVEITADAVHAYLDEKFGIDRRLTENSYEFGARLLRRLGFTDLRQVNECIADYDADQVSRALWGTRQGPIQLLEDVLLASMGEYFFENAPPHPWTDYLQTEWRNEFAAAEIQIGQYVPANGAEQL